jgi:hypothetical protein
VLPLANEDVPAVPEMLTRYGVGALREREVGTRNVTVAMVPAVRENPVAVVCTVGAAPEVAGVKVTVMPLATIVDVGKPLPVKRTGCTLGSTTDGDADAGNVTTPEDGWLLGKASSELSEDAALTSVPQLVTPRHRKRITKADATNLVTGRLAEIRLKLRIEFGIV